ncbi:hypothetical protein I6K44_02965 [Klebsiella pneumoniae]|jgi:hypothetical protein|uniref:hypothetical protein n=1 Tax=Klebsiella TaxID=570 RepID=UPI00032DB520|nr:MULTISPECIES: hypothetical protein [Klebsiella]DAQ12595.1 MAG TPA: outer membrane protein assembly factor [Caudoviricetes sp.]HDG7838644.1 hypothetical protein [Klebsiella quasipneumoniae]EJD6389122.1 hypothetical protein [Klebsiella pneumoniae]EKU1229568.1 hypothetical protein [Klebsiella pneumoniae]EKU1243986.1 hypothetical protein [Klebsiella pneumoniae]
MNNFAILVPLLCLVMLGCTYTNQYESGSQIAVENVNRIVKGKTTEAELIGMFGQPFSKAVISATEVKWIYTHNAVSASAQAFTMKTTSSAEMTTLDILLKDGVVVNYAYTKSPLNPTMNMKTSL